MPRAIRKQITVTRTEITGYACSTCNTEHDQSWKAQECEQRHIRQVQLAAMPPGFDTIAFYFTSEDEMKIISDNGDFEGEGWYVGWSGHIEAEGCERWQRLDEIRDQLDTHVAGVIEARNRVHEILADVHMGIVPMPDGRCQRCDDTMRHVEDAERRVPCPIHGTSAWDAELQDKD